MKQTYQAPSEETAGIRNLVLIYNGYYEQNRGNWMPEEFLPYLLYQRRDGSFSERFFDGFLFLGLLGPQGGQSINLGRLELVLGKDLFARRRPCRAA